MMELLDKIYLNAMNAGRKLQEKVKAFLENENGVSNVVATIIILLIAVLLIAAFWSQLKSFAQGIMDTIFGTEFNSDGLSS